MYTSSYSYDQLVPSAVIGRQTPYERVIKREPTYDHLRIIICLCYASSSEKKGDEFEAKG